MRHVFMVGSGTHGVVCESHGKNETVTSAE